MKTTSPKELWKVLIKGNKSKYTCPVKIDTFYEHFKQLNNTNITETDKVACGEIINHSKHEFNFEQTILGKTNNGMYFKTENNKIRG